MVDAELEMDAKHGPIIRVIVDGTKVAVYLAQEIGVVTPPTNRDQYGIEVKGPWWKYRQYVETPSIDHAGDIAIPDEVVDLKLLLECRRERDEARRERERLREETLTWRTQFEAVCETRNAFQIEIRRLKDEAERLREGKDLLAKQLAYYRRDNEKLNNALAWEHNESENAMDAKRYRWLKRQASTDDYDTRVNVIDDILAQYGERWDALIDAAMDGK